MVGDPCMHGEKLARLKEAMGEGIVPSVNTAVECFVPVGEELALMYVSISGCIR